MSGYFDYNATTPLHPAAGKAWLRASDHHWQNASSLYREAATVKQQLEAARERLGECLGCEPERIVFTSGATEANNAIVRLYAAKQGAILSSSVEHPSLRFPLQRSFGSRLRLLRMHGDTSLDFEDFSRQVAEDRPALVTVMAANNEWGTLHPWRDLAQHCKEHAIPFHCDASQWIGKLPSQELGLCDYITGSGHKFGGPKGVGFLVMRDESELLGFIDGGPQEEGRRAGTENYPAIEAMVTALEAVSENLDAVATQQSGYRDHFAKTICHQLPGTRLIGGDTPRLWNTLMLVLPAHDNRKWLARLSQLGFAISTGAACSAGREGASMVLQTLGISLEEMQRVIRISSGWETSAEDWTTLEQAILQVSKTLGL
ncbi:cysteine desulfurase NifS [soil metagenome]